LKEDVGTAPSEKNDNDWEKGEGIELSVDKENVLSLGSTESSHNTTNQIAKMVPQGKFRGKEEMLKQYLKKKKNKEEIKRDFYLLQRTGLVNLHQESIPNVSRYYAVFTMIWHHNIPEDLHSLTEFAKDILTTLSSQRTPIRTPIDKFNSQIASRIMSHIPRHQMMDFPPSQPTKTILMILIFYPKYKIHVLLPTANPTVE
jgi:hypothetical protein